jgi:hypothetical protein
MRRRLAILALAALATASCGSGDDKAAPPTTTAAPVPTSTSTSAPATTSTARTGTSTTTTRPGAVTSTTVRRTAATAVIGPASVAGIPLGATKAQAIAVLGQPTTSGQENDLSGKKYDFLTWRLDGNRGLTLSFGTESVTSPLLTDWMANATGPVTTGGVRVGDSAAKVTAAHGALLPFCCDTQVASVMEGGGRMIVVVPNATQKVASITGGDPAYWSRKIAD